MSNENAKLVACFLWFLLPFLKVDIINCMVLDKEDMEAWEAWGLKWCWFRCTWLLTHAFSTYFQLCHKINVYTKKLCGHREVMHGGVRARREYWNPQEEHNYISYGSIKTNTFIIKLMGIRARGLDSALHGIQGDAWGPRSEKGGPEKGTYCWSPAAGKGFQGQFRSHVKILAYLTFWGNRKKNVVSEGSMPFADSGTYNTPLIW